MKALTNVKIVFPEEIREGTVLTEGESIVAVGAPEIPAGAEIVDGGGLFAGPGLVDEHVHGYSRHGIDLDVRKDPAAMAENHLLHGTTAITPSAAYSYTKEEFLTISKNCLAAMEKGGSSIVGIHYEGPFVNANQGAHSEKAWKYSEEACREILDAGKGKILHCTYAPELQSGPGVEKLLAEYGITADIGHTVLSPDDAERAVKNGARIVTHLFDAMGCWRGTDSIEMTGTLQEQAADILLSLPGLSYELICDSRCIHVKPVSIRLAYRVAGEDGIIVVSDCSVDGDAADTSAYPEEDPRSAYDLNWNDIGQLSGSRLTVLESARNFMRVTGTDLRVAFKCASTNPAKALGLYDRIGSIEPGKEASLILTDEGLHLKRVMFRGAFLPEIREE